VINEIMQKKSESDVSIMPTCLHVAILARCEGEESRGGAFIASAYRCQSTGGSRRERMCAGVTHASNGSRGVPVARDNFRSSQINSNIDSVGLAYEILFDR